MSHADPEAGRGTIPALGAYFIIPLMACGLTAYYLVSTIGLIWEAKATGIVIGITLVALCVAQFIRLGLKVARGEGTLGLGDLAENSHFNRQRLTLIVLSALFIVSLPWVGTTAGLFLVIVASIWVMGVRDWRVLIAVAAITAATVHFLLIYLLGSQLPQGVFKNLFSFGGA